MTITCTYDHRIIQGAESGMFLGKVQELLEGAENFYEEVFAHLKMPHQPVRWAPDRQPTLPGLTPQRAEAAKEAGVIQFINAYRVRGHLIADLDPLACEPSYHPELDPSTYGLTHLGSRSRISHRVARRSNRRRRAPAGGHSARDSRNAAANLLRQGRHRVHEHPASGGEALAAASHGTGFESSAARPKEARQAILHHLFEAEEFEHFLHARFVGQKRFALEGAETAIAILDELIDRAADPQRA